MLRKHLLSTAALLLLVSLSFRAQTPTVPSPQQTDQIITDPNGNSKADPGDKIRYKVTVQNTGTGNATGVKVNAVPDARTTLDLTSFRTSPLAIPDGPYSCIGNVGITVPDGASDLLNNDYDDAPAGLTASVATNAATAQGGTITIAANGSFSYNPPRGFEGTDTYQYTLNDGNAVAGVTATDVATVTFTVSGMIWFINNIGGACASNCDGRLSNPYTSLSAFNTANALSGGLNPDNNDNIFIYENATTYTGGIVLRTGQKLVGQDATVTLDVALGLTLPTFSNGLPPMFAGAPFATIAPGAGVVGVTLANGNTVRGIATSGGLNGVSGSPASLTFLENNLSGSSAEGLKLTNPSGTVSITSNNVAATGNGVNVTTTSNTVSLDLSNNTLNSVANGANVDGSGGGTLNITGFANNVVSQNNGGTGININTARFDATPGGAYNLVSGGTTVIGASGNGVGTSGMVLTNVSGDLSFTDLDIFADSGTGLSVTSTGAVNTGAGTGFRLAVGAGVGIIEATGGPAVSVSNASINLPLASLKSTNSSTNGIALSNAFGGAGSTVLSAGAGSSITHTSGASAAISIDNGNGNFSYGGTVNNTSGGMISVANRSSGTIDFTGSLTHTASANGVNLTNNTGAAINFTGGGLIINTTSGTGFNATGGGTVTVQGTGNKINNTTGPANTNTAPALNVDNTTIGASGLTFESISSGNNTAAADPANGIVLNATGSGGLSVTGTGTTDGTGGTIQNTTGRGASFISASNITLKNMNFTNAGTSDLDADNSGLSTGDNLATNAAIHLQSVSTATLDNLNISGGAEQGINGNTVSNFTLSNSSMVDVGNAPDEDGIHFYNMSGTSAITNTTINCTVVTPNTTGGDDHLNLQMQSGTLNLTISGGSVTNANKGSGYLFGIRGTANATITFSNATSTTNFSGGIVADAFDNANMNLTVTNSTSSGNNDQLSVSAGDNSDVDLNASGNTLSSLITGDFVVVSLLGSALDNGFTFDATLNDNDITVGNGLAADGILVNNAGGGAMKVKVTNSTFIYAGTQRAMVFQSGSDGPGSLEITVTGNNIDIQLDGTGNAAAGILAQCGVTDPQGVGASMCADIGGAGALANTFTHSQNVGAISGGDIRVRQRFNNALRLPGLADNTTDPTVVVTYLNGRNNEITSATASINTEIDGGSACLQP